MGGCAASSFEPSRGHWNLFPFGGGGPRPGAYAFAHLPYLAWEDDACPPDISCWDQAGCGPGVRVKNGVQVATCHARDNSSYSRDVHINTSRFVSFVDGALAVRRGCIAGTKHRNEYVSKKTSRSPVVKAAQAPRQQPHNATPTTTTPYQISASPTFMARLWNVIG